MTRRRPIRKLSERQAKRLKEYRKVLKEWFKHEANRFCPVIMDVWGRTVSASECHHTRGRAGKLLFDTRFFLAVSRQGHRWIQDHPREARINGWLCDLGKWNRQPKD